MWKFWQIKAISDDVYGISYKWPKLKCGQMSGSQPGDQVRAFTNNNKLTKRRIQSSSSRKILTFSRSYNGKNSITNYRIRIVISITVTTKIERFVANVIHTYIYPFIKNHDDRTHHVQWKTCRIYQTNKKNEQQLILVMNVSTIVYTTYVQWNYYHKV